MLISTRGIVLYQADYSETSLITKIFTEHLGLQSYIVKGVRKKRSGIKRNLFGPLSVVDIVAYTRESGGLHHLKEVTCHRQFPSVSADIRKSSILLFMNELLYRSIRGEMADSALFSFMLDSIVSLEEARDNLAGFPVLFSLQLASFLGFAPQNNFSEANHFFDMEEGAFVGIVPPHANYIDLPLSKFLSGMIRMTAGEDDGADHNSRTQLLERILDYFRLHMPAFGQMRSPQVLSTILRD